MFKKIFGVVKWVVDVAITVLPYTGAFKYKKALESAMTAVQAFGKNDLPADKWELLKATVTKVSKDLGGDKLIAKTKARLEKKKAKLETRLAKKLFGD